MNDNIVFREFDDKSFGYSGDFKKMIQERRGLIKFFQDSVCKLVNAGDEISEGDVTIHLFDVRGLIIPGKDFSKSRYYKVDVGNRSFFVKSCAGFRELKDTVRAGEKLANVPGVKVINVHYGFSDTSGQGYFVSEWVDLPTLETVCTQMPEAQFKQIEKRVRDVKAILGPAYFDTRIGNTFYDEENDTVVLFDLNELQSLPPSQDSKKES